MAENRVQKKKKKQGWKIVVLLFLLLSLLLAGAAAAFYFAFVFDLPRLTTLKDYNPYLVSEVYSQDDVLIGEFFIERRTVVPLAKMPRMLINAFVAAEDARFFEHRGIDYWRILGATFRNIEALDVVQGGSTITQQIAKSFFLTPERKFTRKNKRSHFSPADRELSYQERDPLPVFEPDLLGGRGLWNSRRGQDLFRQNGGKSDLGRMRHDGRPPSGAKQPVPLPESQEGEGTADLCVEPDARKTDDHPGSGHPGPGGGNQTSAERLAGK